MTPEKIKALVITPTYNECDNIGELIDRIRWEVPSTDILVVDDNSPDGTAEYVTKRMADDGGIFLLSREKKQGLGTAYVAGFQWALDNGYDAIIQMDADLSHDASRIPEMFKALREHDLVIGSRYISGVNVVNWPITRLILSWSANKYAKIITGVPVQDLTGGFKCWRREVLEKLHLESIRSEGYAFQIETTFRAHCLGFRVAEIPIIFVDRTEGTSKMSKDIIFEAVWVVIRLKLSRILGTFRPGRISR